MAETQVQSSRETSTENGRTSSPYSRENYFSSIAGEYDTERSPQDPSTHEHSKQQSSSGTEKNEWIAKGILRDGATFICPIVLHEDPNQCPVECETYIETGDCDHESLSLHDENWEVELSDPIAFPPSCGGSQIEQTHMQRKAPSTNRWRVNTEYGYLVFGGILQDRPAEEFLEIVDDIIRSMDRTILGRDLQEARDLARRLKQSGDHSDVDIMERVVQKLTGLRS